MSSRFSFSTIFMFCVGVTSASISHATSPSHEHLSAKEAVELLSIEPVDFRITLNEKTNEAEVHGVFPTRCLPEQNISFGVDADHKQIAVFIKNRDCLQEFRQECIDFVNNLKNGKTTLEEVKAKSATERKCEIIGKTVFVKQKIGELVALSDDSSRRIAVDALPGEFKIGVAQDDTFIHEMNSSRPRFSFKQFESLAYKTSKQKEIDAQAACQVESGNSSNDLTESPVFASLTNDTSDVVLRLERSGRAKSNRSRSGSSSTAKSVTQSSSNYSSNTSQLNSSNGVRVRNLTQDYGNNPYGNNPYGNYPYGGYGNGYDYGQGTQFQQQKQQQHPFFIVPPSPIAMPGNVDNPMTEIRYFQTIDPYSLDPHLNLQNILGSSGGFFPGLQNFLQMNFPGVSY